MCDGEHGSCNTYMKDLCGTMKRKANISKFFNIDVIVKRNNTKVNMVVVSFLGEAEIPRVHL